MVPSYKTVRGNLAKFGKLVGVVCVRHGSGATYSIWSISERRFTHRWLPVNSAADVVLAMLEARANSAN